MHKFKQIDADFKSFTFQWLARKSYYLIGTEYSVYIKGFLKSS